MARLFCIIAGVVLLGGVSATDDVSLLQANVNSHEAEGPQLDAMSYGRLQVLMELNRTSTEKTQSEFDCRTYPRMCQAPFNCQNVNGGGDWSHGIAAAGHANIQSWCAAPQYAEYATKCIADHDLMGAALYQEGWARKQGDNELDASYCFTEGHCSNTLVNPSTTLDQADQMCNFRYGHKWNEFTFTDPKILASGFARRMIPGHFSKKTGFKDTTLTKYFAQAACAMGNYHCDVIYCQQVYCRDPTYYAKYAYLSSPVAGHLKQDFT